MLVIRRWRWRPSRPASAMSRRASRHVTFVAGVIISGALVVTAALSLVWTPADPLAMAIGERLQGPSPSHPFGTDQYGRDILARVMAGALTPIAVGVLAAGIGVGPRALIGPGRGRV